MNTQTVNISLPKKLVKIMDSFAETQFSTRSELIRTAVIRYINEDKKLFELFSYAEKKAKELNIKEEDIENIIDDYRKGR
ncbi:CopG family transcriptional regulator [Candidatus Roizmanbacteria bacterium CG_4_9_14_3_um_filter_33_18]|uniref:CopG family transcriptional regulator n=3 Tax=Candidatus Roizmaniibacteriota TaxID=1752723 RepID=A0A2M7UAQ8_9BACT|nr:MAG: CopG family transcriptional regulator [Candidatus Roizmanbacteria bacterium CG22_combo_CG10-13_8_21_14_all_34_12]PIZ68314.1 MAG: CopG family transcriptional regulator [Candidatus Roizmanbacteria bacterium CG_4_10_14_0_2_um_filter_33_96]PJA55262.1 MAG: CopG family transcriptional regulator [Candidatus Roizmanbacteria bacterium CG_4_9_14_3_um_filter_33_18]